MSFRCRILESSHQNPLDLVVTENGGCLLRKNWVSPPLSPVPVSSQPSKIGGQDKQLIWCEARVSCMCMYVCLSPVLW